MRISLTVAGRAARGGRRPDRVFASRSNPGHNRAVSHHQPDPAPGAEPERGFVVAVLAPGVDEDEELGEIRELLRTAGVAPVGELVQRRAAPDPRTYVGKGKLEELKRLVADAEAESLVVDDDLDPGQQRRLEDALSARVLDRTQLILDIFAQHARERRGQAPGRARAARVQPPAHAGHVEAPRAPRRRHRHARPRRVPARDRPPARPAADRRPQAQAARARAAAARVQRKARERSAAPVVALAGYTNAGKSTLLNALTDADVSVDDRLFETLDPTTRGFEHDGRRYLVTDTVGFIRRLPHQLVEGFAATLEETLLADLVLHVVDASRGGRAPRRDDRGRRLGARRDRRRRAARSSSSSTRSTSSTRCAAGGSANRFPDALQISARGGEGLDELRARIAERFADRFRPVRLLVPYDRRSGPQGALRPGRADRGAGRPRRTASSSTPACPSASWRATRRT